MIPVARYANRVARDGGNLHLSGTVDKKSARNKGKTKVVQVIVGDIWFQYLRS